jgi:hypothetical protein
MAEPDPIIGPEEVAYSLDLTPAQLKVTYYALRAYRDDFGHEERDVLRVVNELLTKFPDEASLRDVRLK